MRKFLQLAIVLVNLALCAHSVFGQAGGLVNATRGFPQPNDTSTGTTLNGTAIVNSSGNAINAGTSNTSVPTYIVIGGAGTSGNAVLASQGTLVPCTMDSTISSGAGGYFVINSPTTASDCHAQSTAPSAGSWVIGYLWASSTSIGVAALVSINSTFVGLSSGCSSSGPCPINVDVSGSLIGKESTLDLIPGTNFTISPATDSGGAVHLTLNSVPSVSSTRRTCMIVVGTDDGSALANSNLGPQGDQCYIPYAATIVEVMVTADAGMPNVIPGRNHLGSIVNLVSSALATAASGGRACSNIGGTTSLDGSTTCSATLQNTSISQGDFLNLVSGTAGGTAHRMSIAITFTVS